MSSPRTDIISHLQDLIEQAELGNITTLITAASNDTDEGTTREYGVFGNGNTMVCLAMRLHDRVSELNVDGGDNE